MRIIQVATLITPDGAYGGPVRVAVNQTRALLNAGHEVVMAAAARGFKGVLPNTFDGVPAKLFPARNIPKLGFAGTFSPSLLEWLRRAAQTADVLHIHMGRDFVTLPAAAIAARRGTPYVTQTHGMIAPSSHIFSGPVDAFWTKRALNGANRVLYLTNTERSGLLDLGTNEQKLQELPNGVPALTAPSPLSRDVEVLFLARLHTRKRPLMFIEMAKRLQARFPAARFVLVGPDEGEGSSVRSAIAASGMGDRLSWEGPVEPHDAAARIGKSSIYVLPSIDEPFPMAVLEAMSLGKPVVITDTCGLADAVTTAGAGVVTGPDIESLTTAVADLLASHPKRQETATNAQRLARERFGMDAIVRKLSEIYSEAARDRGL